MTTNPANPTSAEQTSDATPSPRIAVVTGATRGLGLQTTRDLLTLGWTVWLGARDADRGATAAAALAGLPGHLRVLPIDVTDDDSVAAAAATVADHDGHVDVVVNNAGISGGWTAVTDTEPKDFLPVFGVNVLGPVRVVCAFLPLLEQADHPAIVNVSSGLGSHGITSDPDRIESTLPGLVYPSSKAALNMLTAQWAKALPHVRVNSVDPGYTATDLNAHTGPKTVAEGARVIVALATDGPDGPTGGFFDDRGALPW